MTDLDQTLAEIRRVLLPGGPFVFFEHVARTTGHLVAAIATALDAVLPPVRQRM